MLSSRSQAHSEPLLINQSKVESRPSSSHEYRKPIEEAQKPSPLVVEALAESLGINLESQLKFQWIVKNCLLQLAEQGWKCDVVLDGTVKVLFFVHLSTSEKRSVHEVVEMHRELTRRIVYEHEDLVSKRLDPIYQIQELVFERLLGVVDSRKMATPCLIERILVLLKVDILSESYLARTVKEEIDTAFFKTRDAGGPNFVNVESCFNVQELQARIAIDRIAYMKSISDSKLLFCVECQNALADGMCATCGDCLCACCHSRLHSKGSRKDHLFVFLEQCVCSECELRASDIRCVDCADLFCYECFKKTHKTGKRTKHCVQLPTSLNCFNCAFKEANLICLDCHEALCCSCSLRMHGFEPRRNHEFYGVRGIAYPRKLFANNIESLSVVIEKCLADKKPKNWLLMYDSDSEPFWYNFYTRETVKTTMKNTSSPPVDPPELVDEITKITSLKARERAILDVPSKFVLHFRPEIRI